MKHKYKINLGAMVILLAIMLITENKTAYSQQTNGEITRNTPYVPGEILVSFPEGYSPRQYASQATALAEEVQAAVVDQYRNLALFDFGAEADVEAIAEHLMVNDQALVAQPNYIHWIPEKEDHLLGDPLVINSYAAQSDAGIIDLPWDQIKNLKSYYYYKKKWRAIASYPVELTSGKLWGWDTIQADLVWTETKASPYICLLDTGVDASHPDLKGKVVNGYDFINDDRVPNDDNGHGTHIAGILVAKTNSTPKGDTDSAAGVSNSKIYNVKVMNSQGYGTSYSIAAGLVYCGNLKTVKIINMSLGSYTQDSIEWNAVKYALLGKNRVLVAAAGNDSTSEPFYPAAWSTLDGYNGESIDEIKDKIIAVSAGRSPSSEGTRLWVDANNDGLVGAEGTEVFSPEQCASGLALQSGANGSNYGPWVSIVAPGEAIYSTTPINYPFYLNYFEPHVTAGYDYLSGTSQAAAFVSGAAARLWSIASTETPANIKNFLIERGESLTLAATSRDLENPSLGYDNTYEAGLNYGDVDDGYIIAPFCWPTANGDFTGEHSMDNATYLNLAAAMQRTAMLVEVKDATSGLPFENKVPAYVEAKDTSTKTAGIRRAYARTTPGSAYVALLNIPTNYVVDTAEGARMKYNLTVSRKGNTSGYQVFNQLLVDPSQMAGNLVTPAELPYNRVSLAPNTNVQFVLDWFIPGEVTVTTNLDMFLWAPPVESLGVNDYQIVGPATQQAYNLAVGQSWPGYLGMGTLLDPKKFDPTGFTKYSPYTQFVFDGGAEIFDQTGRIMNPEELITSKAGTSIKANPFVKMKHEGAYYLTVTDYGEYFLNKNVEEDLSVAPVVRVWVKGKLVETIRLQDNEIAGDCVGPENWWRVLKFENIDSKNALITPLNTCDINSDPR